MSLLEEAMENCIMVDKTTAPDGYGGIITTYTEGAPFRAAFAFDNSTPARVGSVEGLTALYTISTPKNIILQFHDIIRRESDMQVFRITSDGDDKKTPASAGLDIRGVSAEKWNVGYIAPKEGTDGG